MVIITPPATPGSSASYSAVSFFKAINSFMRRVKKKIGKSNGSLKPLLPRPINNFRRKEEGEMKAKDFGEGGLWRQEILRGGRCEPLDFPGVIYYDSNGNQLSEVPIRSPMASPLPIYLFNSSEAKLR